MNINISWLDLKRAASDLLEDGDKTDRQYAAKLLMECAEQIARQEKEAAVEAAKCEAVAIPHDWRQERRDHYRREASQLFSRFFINHCDDIRLAGPNGGMTATARFEGPRGTDVPTLAAISVTVEFGWATKEEALMALDVVTGMIQAKFDDNPAVQAEAEYA